MCTTILAINSNGSVLLALRNWLEVVNMSMINELFGCLNVGFFWTIEHLSGCLLLSFIQWYPMHCHDSTLQTSIHGHPASYSLYYLYTLKRRSGAEIMCGNLLIYTSSSFSRHSIDKTWHLLQIRSLLHLCVLLLNNKRNFTLLKKSCILWYSTLPLP